MDWGSVVLSAITGIVGAAIGTYWGTQWLASYKNKEIIRIRNMGIKALHIIKKYSKNKQYYSHAANEFNTTLSVAEKRSVLVALHKLGLPILFPVDRPFSLNNISFPEEEIDEKYIQDIILQVQNGYADKLFFLDVEEHFNADLRLRSLRNIAKKYIDNILAKTKISEDKCHIQYEDDCWINFSPGEVNSILVFKRLTMESGFYDKNGNIRNDTLELLKKEVDLGIWDSYLQWDITAYNNMCTQKLFAEIGINAMQSQNITMCDRCTNTSCSKKKIQP